MNGVPPKQDRIKEILKDLGRSTLRGVRKCYKCGTINGSRGLSCKNKACDVVFSEAGLKKKCSVEVCRLITSSSPQIFSVRVRDKGPDFRGFVQLPVAPPNLEENDTISPVTSICFVEACQKLFTSNLLKCHEKNILYSPVTCQHIQSAQKCCIDAVVLKIDHKALQSLNITQYMKNTIWQSCTETPEGSIVQRVSKSIMAVKCKVTTKHPLGFLHISFSPVSKNDEKECAYVCTCSSFKSNSKSTDSSKHCVHYFACVAAFASDIKLSLEFAPYVFKEKGLEEMERADEIDADESSRFGEIFSNAMSQASGVVLSKDDENNFLQEFPSVIEGLAAIVDVTNEDLANLDNQTLSAVITKLQTPPQKNKPVKKKKKIPSPRCNILKKEIKKKKTSYLPFSEDIGDPNEVNLPFIEWLSSVTERINLSLHITPSGRPQPQSLVYHIPHLFFDCLIERLSSTRVGLERKILPKSVSSIIRDTPPLGKFFKFSWQITNLAHAKAVFSTPLLSLEDSKSFVQKSDGTYEIINNETLLEGLFGREGVRPIRPVEFKSFLKIGTISSQGTPSVLTLHWTPNLLPISKVGELVILYDYGIIEFKPAEVVVKTKRR